MANVRYENIVLENKLRDQLETALNMLDYVTVDDSLTESAGMEKVVNVYSASGEAQDVEEGEGNTQSIEMSFAPRKYKVGTTQARFIYTDEDQMADPFLVDGGVKKLSEALVNRLNAKTNNQYWNARRYVSYTQGGAVGFDAFVDAIALLNKERDEEAQLFALVNPAMKATLRKSLKDDLKYNEDYARTGYIGHVAGVPVTTCKQIPDGCVIIASKKAVTYLRKKNVEVEQDRNKNTRLNTIYGRQVGIVAFTDEGECAIIAPKNTDLPTITESTVKAGSDVTISGTCVADASVDLLRGGVKIAEAAVTGTAWSCVVPTVKAGEKYVARAYAKGFAPTDSAEKTAASA